ncbi:hypothetical protein Btru_047521 [Bulinus truncatus]|nr:hypothetical protein Btru_047521 [Bulinus truncatus]
MNQRTSGPVNLWTSGPVDQLTSGPVDHLTSGPVEQLTSGPVDQLTSGPLNQWTSGPVDQLTSGPVDQEGELTPGISVRRIGGGLRYEILLPTGTKVENQYLNVLIVSSANDFNRTKILNNKIIDKGSAMYVKANYFSFNEITCYPPTAGSYKVQVSNNNQTFSEVLIFTLFDPGCHTCTSSGACSLVILNQEVVVTEGLGPAYVQVESNVPPHLLCYGEDSDLCSVYLSLNYIRAPNEYTCPQSETTYIQQLTFPFFHSQEDDKSCSAKYRSWPGPVSIPVIATVDSLIDNNIKRSLDVFILMEYNSTLEKNISIGYKEVQILDRDSPTMCGSINDPHITTFDKKNYDVFIPGEYILYQNTKFHCEVHTFFRPCNGRAACNCAVTVKSGDDVFLFDRCGPKESEILDALDIKLFRNGELTANTYIIQQSEGRKYTILLPTGTKVIIHIGGQFLNVWIEPSALDFNSTSGLCGTYNGKESDDYMMPGGVEYTSDLREPNNFSLSWRVDKNASHYGGVCVSENLTQSSENVYCSCLSLSDSTCSTNLRVNRCPLSLSAAKRIDGGVDVTHLYINGSLALSACYVKEFQYNENYTSPTYRWPTASNWTEEKALNFCINYLTSSQIGLRCSNLSLDFNKTVQSCVNDIKIMDSTSYAIEAFTNLLEQCLSISTRSVDLYIGNKPDRNFYDQICLNNCNNNGNCSNGVCECSRGFGGIDCSVNLTSPPVIKTIQPSVCDVKYDSCNSVTLIGGPFIDSKNLTCIFEEINYLGDKGNNITRRYRTEKVIANFITYEKISCKLPYVASFTIKVYNVENITSESSVIYQTFSTDCFDCKGTCTIQNFYCFINNVCYRVTQSNSTNPDLVCDPQKNKTDWTNRNDFPKIEAKLEVKTHFNANGSEFAFVCDWGEYRSNNSNIIVFAQWFHDDQLELEQQILNNDSHHEISHHYINNLTYTSKIYCGLIACDITKCNISRSPIVRSPDFKLEIKIVGSSELVVTEGAEDRVFRLSSNFPPLIFCNQTTDCSIFISMKVSSDPKDIHCPSTNSILPQLALRWSDSQSSQTLHCGVVLTNYNWQQVQTIFVRAVADGQIDGDQTRYIYISAHLTEISIVSLQSVKVKVVDSDQIAICQSINDPHMTTFDEIYYNNFYVGEFILYRRIDGTQEVRAFYQKCNDDKASCNCGVLVRRGKQIFRLTRCGPKRTTEPTLPPLQVDMINDGPQNPDMTVIRYDDGKKYEILITGTKVEVTIGKRYINIIIQASTYDLSRTEGLCGSFDKNATNDLIPMSSQVVTQNPDVFSLSWRVKPEDSMYGGYCNDDEDAITPSNQFCACSNISSCNNDVGMSSCQAGFKNILRGIDITAELHASVLKSDCSNKFDYNTSYVPQIPTWPTPSNYTQDKARTLCENYIQKSISGQACIGQVLSPDEYRFLINGCVDDILILDSVEFLMSVVDNLNMRCLVKIQVDMRYWIIETHQVYINKSIIGNICPDNCNEKGNCSDGVCVCQKDYGGAACNIDLGRPPVITDLAEKRNCDLNVKHECKPEFFIFGENFLNNISLTCHMRQLSLVNKTIKASDSVIKVAAKYISINKISCTVNISWSYAIAISNDGYLTTNYSYYWLYNSSCVTCTTNPDRCTIKTDTCFIGNTCYMFDEPSPSNRSESCQPATSQTAFTLIRPSPNVRQPEISTTNYSSSPYFEVYCSTNKDEICSRATYEVKWENGNGSQLTTSNLQCGTKNTLKLNDLHNFQLGDSLKCAVRGCYNVNDTNTCSEWRYSDILTSDIKIPESIIEVTEDGKTDQFHVTSPFPPGVFCGNSSNWENCTMKILFSVQQNMTLLCQSKAMAQVVFSHSDGLQCGIQFNKSNWETTYVVEVKAVQDNLVEPVQEMNIVVTAEVYVGSNRLSNKVIGTLKLTVLDSVKRKQCSGGTHIKTFDGEQFTNDRRGEFILYQTRDEYFEVRSLQAPCHDQSSLTCSCCIMVRSGNDVLVIDNCASSNATDIRLYLNDNVIPRLRVTSFANGQMYRVSLPSGSEVEVIVNQGNLNAVIYGSQDDFNMVEGLCANSDGIPSNDLLLINNTNVNDTTDAVNKFIEHWRANSSYLNGACQKVVLTTLKRETLCDCQSTNSSCSTDPAVTSCEVNSLHGSSNNVQIGKDITSTLVQFARTPTACCDTNKEFDYKISTNYQPRTSSWPTDKYNLTEQNVRNICRTGLNESFVMMACKNYLDYVDLEKIIASCVSDIQTSEDTALANKYVSLLLWTCVRVSSTNVSQWLNNGTNFVPPDLGICLSSSLKNCTCTTDNCRVNLSNPPTIFSQGGVCDISSGTKCNVVEILGAGFIDSENLTCHINDNGTENMTMARFISSNKVICNVTLSRSVDIQISLNGVNKSSAVSWILYNGNCQSCNGQSCTVKPGTCSIGNQCFECGHIFKDDPSRFCGPNDTSSWSLIPDPAVYVKRYSFVNSASSSASFNGDINFDSTFGRIIFSALGQSVKIPKLSPLDTDSCSTNSAPQLGFTLQFTLKLATLCDGYILNTWGENGTGSGPAVSICNGWVFVTVRNQDREWSLQVAQVEVNKLINVEISWAASYGLSVQWNDMVRKVVSYKVRHMKGTYYNDLFVGSLNTDKCFTGMTFGGLAIFSAAKPVLIAKGVITEMPTLPDKPAINIEFSHETAFICSFTTLKRRDVSYTVNFTIDEIVVQTEILTADRNTSILNESLIGNATYGSKISCSVTPCYIYNCAELSGPTYTETISFTVEISEKQITLVEGGNSVLVHVVSTVPYYLLCPSPLRSPASSSLSTTVTVGKFSGEQTCQNGNLLRQVVVGFDNEGANNSCVQMLTSDKWIQGNSISLSATVDMVKDGDVQGSISLDLSVVCSNRIINLATQIVQITVIDKDNGKICHSINDPHMHTFDGLPYDNFKEGEFVLYQHNSSQQYAVHAMYRKCNRGIASCNCAVAVRVDDDVVLIDRCGPQKNSVFYPLTVKIIKNGDIDPRLRIISYHQGNQYQIVLPIGTTITVENGGAVWEGEPQFLNVWITSSSPDYKSVLGLCGSFDDNPANDLLLQNGNILQYNEGNILKFAESWRVTGNDSLYSGYCPEQLKDIQTSKFCSCPFNGSAYCSSNENFVYCRKDSIQFKLYNDITDKLIEQAKEPDHCYDPNTDPVIFEADITYTYDIKTVQWPTPSGLEEQYVRNLCTEAVTKTSLAAAGCDKNYGIDIKSATESCVKDIKMTDNVNWITALKNNIRIQCTIQNSQQLTSQSFSLCPSDCSQNGNCSESICYCKYPYDGFDCSIDRTKPPALYGIVDGNLCDVLQDENNCQSIVLIGFPISYEHARCQLRRVLISSSNSITVNTSSSVIINASFVSIESVRCDVKESGSWEISISNGYDFSAPQLFTKFDSSCENCSLTSGCTTRTDICKVNNECFENGAIIEENRVCDVGNSINNFTVITSNRVDVQFYNFINIIGNILYTATFQFEIFGNPILIDGPLGGSAIRFNGLDQYLDFSSTGFGDLAKCPFGFTLKFSMAIYEYKNKMYILSCGADSARTSGVSIWYQGNKLNARVRYGFKEWKVNAYYRPHIYQDKFVGVQLSWSVNAGLTLFLDNGIAVSDKKFQFKRNNVVPPGHCYFARPLDSTFYSKIAISDVSIVLAYYTMIETLHITSELPRFVTPPRIELFINSTTGKSEFICTFDELNSANISYFVDFHYGKKYLLNQIPTRTGTKMAAALSEDRIDLLWFKRSIFCEISACITNGSNCIKGPSRKSNEIVADFKPVSQLVFPATNDYQQNGPCKYIISSSRWNNGSLYIPILGTIDFLKDGDKRRDVNIFATAMGSGTEYSSLLIETIQVVVKDRDSNRRVCQATGDPHVVTFDGK